VTQLRTRLPPVEPTRSADEIARLTGLLSKPIAPAPVGNRSSGSSLTALAGQFSVLVTGHPDLKDSGANKTANDKSAARWPFQNWCNQTENLRFSLWSRPKRDTSLAKLGHVENVACNYKRGEPLADRNQLAGLCNLCWTIRVLPSQYFPRFVNELSCDNLVRFIIYILQAGAFFISQFYFSFSF